MLFDLLAKTAELRSDNLTIREATRLAENPNDLRWRALAPKKREDSIEISTFTNVDFRPNGGRREWNAQGRELTEKIGTSRAYELIPINPTFHFDERKLQKLRERSDVQKRLVRGVDEWATALADAADRQIEADLFTGWFLDRFDVLDTKSAQSVSVTLGFDAVRRPVEATAWTDANLGTIDVYDRFLRLVEEAIRQIGSVGAVRTRIQVIKQLLKEAPKTGSSGNVRPTLANLEDIIAEEGFGRIKLIPDERTYDKYTDGGNATTKTNYVPQGYMGFQPLGGQVANTHFAPVTRASDYTGEGSRADLQDFTVFHYTKNDGKTLMVECQANALPIPVEESTFVVDTGIR